MRSGSHACSCPWGLLAAWVALCPVSLTWGVWCSSSSQVPVGAHLVLCSQESPDTLPDALQTHVLLQACGAAALQRLDQQQDRQAALPALCQVVRAGARGGAGPMHTQHRPAARACSLRRSALVLCARGTDPRPLQGVEQQEARALGTPHADALASRRFAGAFTLRQRMLNFVQNIQYYMMFEVMEPTWHVLEKNLRSVSSVPLATCLGGVCRAGSRVREAGPGPHSSQDGRQGSRDAQPGLRLLEEHVFPQPWRWHPVQGPGPFSQEGHVTKLQDQKYTDQCFLVVFCL